MMSFLTFVHQVTGAIPPHGYTKGLILHHYNGKLGNCGTHFAGDETVLSISEVNWPEGAYDWTYDTFKILGSFCPQQSGTYQFELNGKPHSQMSIAGVNDGNGLGSNCVCTDLVHTMNSFIMEGMKAHTCYPLEIKYVAGCGLITKSLIFRVKSPVGDWYIPRDELVTAYGDIICEDDYWGPDCSNLCHDCHGNGYCLNKDMPIYIRGYEVKEFVKEILKEKGAAESKICTLLLKPDAYKKDVKLDYVAMEIPNDFIVGFGLDYDELGRNYKDIYTLEA